MKDNTFTFGSLVAAFLASLCCLGPLLLGGLGLGTALVATFAPLRPYFLAPERGSAGGGCLFCISETEASSGLRGRIMRTPCARKTARQSDAVASGCGSSGLGAFP